MEVGYQYRIPGCPRPPDATEAVWRTGWRPRPLARLFFARGMPCPARERPEKIMSCPGERPLWWVDRVLITVLERLIAPQGHLPRTWKSDTSIGFQDVRVRTLPRLSDGLDEFLPNSLDFFSHAQCLGEVGKGQKKLYLARGKDLYGG